MNVHSALHTREMLSWVWERVHSGPQRGDGAGEERGAVRQLEN